MAVRKALRAIEEILLEYGNQIDTLLAQKPVVEIEKTRKAPDNAPVPTAITTTFNKDGSMTVELEWTYIQGGRPSTQTVVVVAKGAAPLPLPVVWEDDVYTLPANATYARLDLPSEHNYRFGVAVARSTPDGLEVGPVQSPTANPDWADIGGVSPGIIGGVTGVINNLAADVTLTEATWVSLGSVTITIPTWALDTKVLITCAVNLAITVTVAGVFQFFWRIKRGATVLYTANQVRFDSAIAITWAAEVGPFMDATALTGSQTYTVELFKDDAGAANNAVVAKAGSQIAATHWSV